MFECFYSEQRLIHLFPVVFCMKIHCILVKISLMQMFNFVESLAVLKNFCFVTCSFHGAPANVNYFLQHQLVDLLNKLSELTF